MKKMRFFGTDYNKSNLVIFEIDEEDAPNAYIWVYLPRKGRKPEVKVEPVTRIYSLINHTGATYYVKEDGAEEAIDSALKILEEMPREELQEKLKVFNDMFEVDESYRERWYNEMEQVEVDTFKEVEAARNGDGYWPEYSDEEQTD